MYSQEVSQMKQDNLDIPLNAGNSPIVEVQRDS